MLSDEQWERWRKKAVSLRGLCPSVGDAIITVTTDALSCRVSIDKTGDPTPEKRVAIAIVVGHWTSDRGRLGGGEVLLFPDGHLERADTRVATMLVSGAAL